MPNWNVNWVWTLVAILAAIALIIWIIQEVDLG